MRAAEFRQLLIVLLPTVAVIVLVAVLVATVLRVEGDGGPETSGRPSRPAIGQDHWHATYQVLICGQGQPNFPTWDAGVHTHADGVIHVHPFLPSERGAGARLVRWFEYGGGRLTQSEMRMPGDRQEYKNGDICPDGSEAFLQVFVNGEALESWSDYIPQDGDRVLIVFGEAGAN